jgi:hypothetical protein
MRSVIDRILTFCEMRARVMGVLVANTEKTLRESAPEGRPGTATCRVSEHTEKRDESAKDFRGDYGQTFEKRLDREVKQMETYIKGRLKHLNDGLDEECENSGPKVLFDNAGLRVSKQI